MDKRRFGRLLKEIGDGSGKAFDEFYRIFYPKIVFRYVRRYGDVESAAETARVFFERLPDSSLRHEDIENPACRLYAVCDEFCGERFCSCAPDQTVGGIKNIQGLYHSPELINALGRLKPVAREIVLMNVFEGYSLKEVALELSITYSNVRQKFIRSLKKIETALGKTGNFAA